MSTTWRLTAGFAAVLCLASALRAHDGDPKLLDKRPPHPGPGWRNAQRMDPQGNLAAGGAGPSFPANNVTLLAWLALSDFNVPGVDNGNSCFGYVSPSGREYAIMGLSTGTAFVEITQPGNPVVVAHINGPQSLWRDMKVFQNYCYAVSEGGGGIQVMNLANIDSGSVSLVNTVDDDATSSTHTLALNPQSGYLYRSGGGSSGLRIYNLNNNPAAPQRVGSWADRYVHEPSVFTYTSGPAAGREIAYCCGGFNTGYTNTGLYVVDVTNKANPTLLKYVTYPNAEYAHQVWPSSDFQWLYLDDELDDGNLGLTCRTRVFNNSNPLDVTYFGFFTNGETSVDHNLYTRDNRIFESNYRTGLRVFSTSNPGTPTAPVEIAYFDTWPDDDDAAFNGLWNNYPYFPSGVVIGSDMERGLFVWWVGTPQIAFALPNGAPATISPSGGSVAVQITESSSGILQPGTAKLHYSTGAGFAAVDLVHQGGNQWSANFPATTCTSTISWYLTGVSTSGIVWSSPQGAPNTVYTATSATGLAPVFTDNFQTNLGWTTSVAGATAGGWQRGVPVNDQGWDYDPVSDSDGSGQCYLTQNSVGNTDVDGGSVTLTSPTINMSAGSIRIAYDYYLYLTDADGSDRLLVQINTNNGTGAWTTIATHATNGGTSWRQHEIGATALAAAGVTPTAATKVRFTANDGGASSIVEAGVDAFAIHTVTCGGSGISGFCSGDGSLATACPCGNTGASGRGCNNSAATGGALLSASGSTSPDTLVLNSSGELSSVLSIFLQGDAFDTNGLLFGDGIRCVAGNLKRLYSKNASGGTASAPGAGDPSITARSAELGDTIAPGSTRYYQVYYRDPSLGFCSVPAGDSFNISNGLTVVW